MDFLKQKIVYIIFVLLGIFAFMLIAVIIFYKPPTSNKSSIAPLPTPYKVTRPSPLPLPTDLEKNYSNLNKVVPGKSTLNDVERINGASLSVTTTGEKTYMYYKTPLKSFTNTVLVEKGVVVYSKEYVFGSYRGSVESFKTNFGEPDITLFDKIYEYPWYVYLDKGIAIENDGKDILMVLYFIPQNKDNFIKSFTQELNLSIEPIIIED